MTFILTLLVFSGGSVAVTAVEYNNAGACEAAKGCRRAGLGFCLQTTADRCDLYAERIGRERPCAPSEPQVTWRPASIECCVGLNVAVGEAAGSRRAVNP